MPIVLCECSKVGPVIVSYADDRVIVTGFRLEEARETTFKLLDNFLQHFVPKVIEGARKMSLRRVQEDIRISKGVFENLRLSVSSQKVVAYHEEFRYSGNTVS